ncbi:glycosyltransferase [Paenibacillus chitinolyticus]|uniref:glycosyltransferase n=1 Tax=Paenibacillus chitinolyticus TaxID=79263 RepID=UPI003642CF1C
MKQPITACIMTRDEQDNIESCIDSLKPYVMEIVILDTGSEDATLEIASNKGVSIYKTVWKNDFSLIRNELIKLARQPVILMIDADEIAIPGQGLAFKAACDYILQNNSYVGKLNIQNATDEGEITTASISRMFNKTSGVFYRGIIHEQIESHLKQLEFFHTDITLAHSGYLTTKLISKNKLDRNLSLLLKELDRNIDDSYLLFQIGRTYSVAGDIEKALVYLKKAYSLSIEDYSFHSTLTQVYGWTLLKGKRFQELFEVLKEAIQLYPDYTDLYFLYGCTLVEIRSVEFAHLIPGIFQSCIELGEPDPQKYESILGVGTFKARYNLGLYYELLGDKKRAYEEYTISAKANFKPALDRLSQISES